ncbi:hypothetical protein GOP47_0017231 [Adiantum capillus-veneris]|uniref:Uncharacterized protein n=1 Tax=Adiantum capillus-veneris TaxID=13818 RepID=A0A9D4UJ77_ADICA|nr:hypothetical protein GOP47_0017231 [Adiantum capillus-veneris]
MGVSPREASRKAYGNRVLRITDAGLVEVLQGATCIRMLDLSYNQGRPRLSLIGECCRELESLNLTSSVTLDDVALETIEEGCTNLRVLNVSWCDYVTPEGWEVLVHSCKKLEELAVIGCEGFNADCLLDIEDGCPNLRALKVSDRFTVHPSLARFRVSRPAVDVQFYNIDNDLTY